MSAKVQAGELVILDVLTPALVQDFGLVLPAGRMGRTARVLADFCRSLDFLELQRRQ